MITYVGVDGCRSGWFYIMLDEGGSADFGIASNAQELWDKFRHAAVILIDVPIGLRDGGGERPVDKAARRLLGRRKSSVFRVPCRRVLYAKDYQDAKRISVRNTGKSLAKQSWNITPKIREVDELLQRSPQARGVVRETHPELAFWALNGCRSMEHYKMEPDGYAERVALLLDYYYAADDVIGAALEQWTGKVGREDVVDALANAVTAWKSKGDLQRIPEKPELDSTGLAMEMVYYIPE